MVATLKPPKADELKRQIKTISLPVVFKADGETPGAFRATFALFNVIDLDKDVTIPGAFKAGAPVRIAQWGHNWGAPAIGTGVIGADGERAWVDGQFNLNMAAGKETYESVKALGELQQWSYGFAIDKWSIGKFAGEDVRFLEAMTVHEISPVMLGAQPLTSTDRIKDLKSGARNSAADLDLMHQVMEHHQAIAELMQQIMGDVADQQDNQNAADGGSDDRKASKRESAKAGAGSRETLAARIEMELLELDT